MIWIILILASGHITWFGSYTDHAACTYVASKMENATCVTIEEAAGKGYRR